MTISKSSRSWYYAGFSAVLTVVVFWYLFTHLTWRQVVEVWRNIDGFLLVLFVVLSLLTHVARTFRYGIILRSVGEYPGFLRLFLTVLVRGFCVDLLPARAGELVYVYILRARLGVELGAAAASFALTFLFDVMALAPLLILAILLVGSGMTLSLPVLAMAGVALFGLSSLCVGILPACLRVGFAWAARMPGHRVRRALRRLMAGTHRQVRRARGRGVYAKVFAWSVVVRLLKYTSLYVLLLAMLLPMGYGVAELPMPKVFIGLVAAETSASLPISGLAGFGAYQGVWALVFTLLGFPVELARLTSVSHHVFSQLYGYSLGLMALATLLVLPKTRDI